MLARDWLNTYYLKDTGLFRVSLAFGAFRSSLNSHDAVPFPDWRENPQRIRELDWHSQLEALSEFQKPNGEGGAN